MPYFANDGLSLYYEVHGTGRPVVMLHGSTVSFERNYATNGWIECLNDRGLQVIGLDFRGHGSSDKPHDVGAYGTGPLAGDVLALVDYLGVARASLVGYSIGSAIALHLLHSLPGRFGRSALVAAGDGLIGTSPRTFAAVLPLLVTAMRRDSYPSDLPAHVAAYWTFVDETGGDRHAAAAAASASYPPIPTATAAAIETPVLIVSGERDPVLGQGRKLAQALGNGRYLEIAGADHFSLAADPAVQVAVADFLAAGGANEG